MAESQYEDDQTIANDAIVWRRVPGESAKVENGIVRPTTGAFQDSTSSPMSATLAAEHDNPQAYLANYPEVGIVAIKAGRLRELGQKIVRDPTDEDAGHLLIVGGKPKGGFRKNLKREATWVVMPKEFR